jgi:hypothetical protein
VPNRSERGFAQAPHPIFRTETQVVTTDPNGPRKVPALLGVRFAQRRGGASMFQKLTLVALQALGAVERIHRPTTERLEHLGGGPGVARTAWRGGHAGLVSSVRKRAKLYAAGAKVTTQSTRSAPRCRSWRNPSTLQQPHCAPRPAHPSCLGLDFTWHEKIGGHCEVARENRAGYEATAIPHQSLRGGYALHV